MSDSEPGGAGGAAREEAARQGVWLAAMLVAIPVLAWLERRSTDPDFARAVKMRAAKTAERAFAMAAARAWAGAEWARRAYEAERPG